MKVKKTKKKSAAQRTKEVKDWLFLWLKNYEATYELKQKASKQAEQTEQIKAHLGESICENFGEDGPFLVTLDRKKYRVDAYRSLRGEYTVNVEQLKIK